MKSEVFNGARFGAYFKYDFRQMWRNHVKASIGIGLSGLILYMLAVLMNLILHGTWQAPSLPARMVIFVLAFAALELYQTRTYGYLTDPRKGSAWLLLPSSGFEKWLSMLIMTLIVIPLFFLAAALGVDGLLSIADPTYGQPLVTSFTEALSQLQNSLVEANATYETTWNTGVMAGPAIAGFVVNFLFFLYCGIRFKRFKILSAFGILFLFGIATTFLFSGFITSGHLMSMETVMEDADLATAEALIRRFIHWMTLAYWGLAALLAFLIYRRIKTLKH